MLFRDLDLPGWPCTVAVGCILAREQLLRLQDTLAIGTIRRRRRACVRKCKRICLGRACDSLEIYNDFPARFRLGQEALSVRTWQRKHTFLPLGRNASPERAEHKEVDHTLMWINGSKLRLWGIIHRERRKSRQISGMGVYLANHDARAALTCLECSACTGWT